MDTRRLGSQFGMFIVLLFVTIPGFDCRKPKKFPLIEDKVEHKQSRTPGCWLGGTFYHLEQRWSPALLPHGTMVCVKCECLPVERKGILQHQGQIVCRNIKDECPKPMCDTPVLLPERCCKTCPGQDSSFEDQYSISGKTKGKEVAISGDEHEKQLKGEFIALLVGRNVRGTPVKTKAVAVVRITVTNGELRYAVRYNRLDRPKFLQITDANGNVLVETPLVKSKKGERKLCGVWQKIPTVYLQYFREKRLFAVITAAKHTKGLIAGRVVPHEQAAKETFAVVMGSPKAEGIGGVASLEYDHPQQQVKYVISFDGIFEEKDFNGEYYVTVEKNNKIIHQSMGRVGRKSNTLTGTWKMTKKRESKQLARGRLVLRVTSRGGNTVSGNIQPRLTCEVFQSLMSGFQSVKHAPSPAAGTAILDVREQGYISYNIRVVGLDSKVARIRLVGPPNKKGKRKVVANLQNTFKEDIDSFSGWANGTYKKLKADDIDLLLNNKLFINVVTSGKKSSNLRGRVTSIPYHTHFQDVGVYPVTLVPVTTDSEGAAAHAWLSMDVGCSLHYDVIVSQATDETFSLMLGTYGNSLMSTAVLGTSEKQEPWTLFETKMMSGSVNSVPEGLFRDLDEGNAFLQVNSGSDIILSGNVTLPNTCWQYAGDIDTDILVDEQREDENEELKFRCYYEGKYFENGDSWKPVVNATCNRCSCNKRTVTCHHVLCPAVTCANPVQGECCPRCPDATEQETRVENTTCELEGDHRQHNIGDTWHPFLPLSGFTKCVLCKCLPGGVPKCDRLPCPKLDCPADERVRTNPGDCCQVCGPKKERVVIPEVKPLKDIDMVGACTFMDEVFADGSRWHPKIAPFGYMKCVVCRCKTGVYNCGRQKCPRLNCKRKIRKSNSCCYSCDPNQPADDEEQPKDEGMCNFGGRTYRNGEKWRPKTAPKGTVRCAVCKCKNSTSKCRIRCSKKRCANDPFLRDPCCRECQAQKNRRKGNSREKSSSKEN
ncbi:chordin-like [Haliotis rufescens]|uniref:chordin-like n=1 Tax=Haliotis rufescens TaxID=6454 RepID=UPI00201E9A86|nr:chordin-like [Haliotis rufescens]